MHGIGEEMVLILHITLTDHLIISSAVHSTALLLALTSLSLGCACEAGGRCAATRGRCEAC